MTKIVSCVCLNNFVVTLLKKKKYSIILIFSTDNLMALSMLEMIKTNSPKQKEKQRNGIQHQFGL